MESYRPFGWDDWRREEADVLVDDDYLTRLALAADPDEGVAPDAVPIQLYPNRPTGSLPLSYMPPVMARAGGWRVPIVVALIVTFLLIDAVGLCMTYGAVVGA